MLGDLPAEEPVLDTQEMRQVVLHAPPRALGRGGPLGVAEALAEPPERVPHLRDPLDHRLVAHRCPPFPGGAAYCASKAGLNVFGDALMQELREDNIRVSTVLPGSVATGFSGRTPDTGAEWKLHAEDVARVIAALLEHPARSLPSRVEIRPSRPKKG